MTLFELSPTYIEAGNLLRGRLKILRKKRKKTMDREELWRLNRRISMLTTMLTQVNELAELTEKYYEKGYFRSEKYTL